MTIAILPKFRKMLYNEKYDGQEGMQQSQMYFILLLKISQKQWWEGLCGEIKKP